MRCWIAIHKKKKNRLAFVLFKEVVGVPLDSFLENVKRASEDAQRGVDPHYAIAKVLYGTTVDPRLLQVHVDEYRAGIQTEVRKTLRERVTY